MPINFADVASKPLDQVERPPLPPVGTYRWTITKLPEQRTTQDDAWDIVEFNVRAVEALDDVEMSDYAGEVSNITNRVAFMFNKNDEAEFEKSLFRLRTFLEKHVKCADEGVSIGQALNNSVNQQFLGTIAWRQDKNDAELFHANIGRTAPLE